MRKNILVLFAFALAAVLCFSACELLDSSGNNGIFGDIVDYNLQGTWNTVGETSSSYIGTLKIGYNTIVISGYSGGTSSTVPFTKYDKSSYLQAYSKKTGESRYGYKGILYIADGVEPQPESFEYYWQGNYPYEYFLEFTFGGKDQILKKD